MKRFLLITGLLFTFGCAKKRVVTTTTYLCNSETSCEEYCAAAYPNDSLGRKLCYNDELTRLYGKPFGEDLKEGFE